MSLAELSAASGLNKTTTHRLLKALLCETLVQKSPTTGTYSLGTGLMALGVQALASSDLRRRVRPVLKKLARETGETATLEVPFEDSMLIMDEVAGPHVLAANGNVGTRWPMHATSTGKIVLAYDDDRLAGLKERLPALGPRTLVRKSLLGAQLDEVRKRGYAETVDELEEGFTAVATPLIGALGDVQGALSIGGPTQRIDKLRRSQFGSALRRAVGRISPDA